MTADHDSEQPAKRSNNHRSGRTAIEDASVTLTEEEVERVVQALGQAYVTMESAGRYVEEQDRAPASIALVAALDAARRTLAAALVRLLAVWGGVAVGLGVVG